MACTDGYTDHDRLMDMSRDNKELIKKIIFLESALCASLKALEIAHAGYRGDSLDVIDYVEAGIFKEDLEAWHREHLERDKRLKNKQSEDLLKEQEAKRLNLRKKEILSSLSDEDKKILGLEEDEE